MYIEHTLSVDAEEKEREKAKETNKKNIGSGESGVIIC